VSKSLRPFVIGFVLGLVLGACVLAIIAHNATSRLDAELVNVRSSLATASDANAELTTELRQLSGELDRSSQRARDQQSTIDRQQQIIAGIVKSLRESGGDIRGQIQAIADGFRRLYIVYHQSPSASQSP